MGGSTLAHIAARLSPPQLRPPSHCSPLLCSSLKHSEALKKLAQRPRKEVGHVCLVENDNNSSDKYI